MKLTQRDKNVITEALEILTDVYIDSDVPEDKEQVNLIEDVITKVKGEVSLPRL